jgi:hypothetical protein
MKLPNGERAIVDPAKLLDYCLSPNHFIGRHKARVFASAGFRREDAEQLRALLLWAAANVEVHSRDSHPFGERYILDFEVPREGRTVIIRSAWMTGHGEAVPRLTTCYVL